MIVERILESLPVQLLLWTAVACAIRLHRLNTRMVPRAVRRA